MSTATIDFETSSACDLTKQGAWLYARHPSTEILCMAYQLPGDTEPRLWHRGYLGLDIWPSPPPEALIDHIKSGGLVEAHNAFFERVVWDALVADNWHCPIPADQWRCSAARARAAGLPGDLAGAADVLDLPVGKDMGGRETMLRLSKKDARKKDLWGVEPPRPDLEILWEYCKTDVVAERLLSQALPPLSERELAVWQADQEINLRGIPFDLDFARSALALADAWRDKLNAELQDLTGIEAGSQRMKIKAWLAERGVKLLNTTAAEVDMWLGGSQLDSTSRRVLEIMRSVTKTSTRKYQSIIDRTDPVDGRARDGLLYHGASTGRWAGRGVQVQNFPRGGLPDIQEACQRIVEGEVEGDVMDYVKEALRGCIVGDSLFSADYSAIEARCLLWLADEAEALDLFEQGGDIYCNLASTIYGRKITKSDATERQLGKQAVLGLGYGMGFTTFLLTCRRYGMSFPEAQCRQIVGPVYERYCAWVDDVLDPVEQPYESTSEFDGRVKVAENLKQRIWDEPGTKKAQRYELAMAKYVVDVYRRKYSNVVELWGREEFEALAAVKSRRRHGRWSVQDDWLCCQLPSGRVMRYREPRIKTTTRPWGTAQSSLVYMGQKLGQWMEIETYGGKLVENITQAVARDIMADAILRLRGSEHQVILSVHDEVVAESQGDLDEFILLMEQHSGWSAGIPITVDAKRTRRWSK